MDHEDLNDHLTAPAAHEEHDRVDETSQRTSATVAFWVLVVFLVCLGLCVLLSLVLVIINGA